MKTSSSFSLPDFRRFPARSLLPRYDYDDVRNGIRHGWQACSGHDRLGPVRMFQWEAINDLPEDAAVRVENGGRYSIDERYRVALVPYAFGPIA